MRTEVMKKILFGLTPNECWFTIPAKQIKLLTRNIPPSVNSRGNMDLGINKYLI